MLVSHIERGLWPVSSRNLQGWYDQRQYQPCTNSILVGRHLEVTTALYQFQYFIYTRLISAKNHSWTQIQNEAGMKVSKSTQYQGPRPGWYESFLNVPNT